MSSMRSASSSTSVRTPRRSSACLRSSSCTRPGVPTTTCGSCASDASCGPSGMPPVSVSSLRLAMPVASLRMCLLTWSASSRVGHSTSACRRICDASRRCSSPSPKAAVLPLPVGACAITSRPSSNAGRHCAWIGVICTWPSASRPWNNAGSRGRSVNSVHVRHDRSLPGVPVAVPQAGVRNPVPGMSMSNARWTSHSVAIAMIAHEPQRRTPTW